MINAEGLILRLEAIKAARLEVGGKKANDPSGIVVNDEFHGASK